MIREIRERVDRTRKGQIPDPPYQRWEQLRDDREALLNLFDTSADTWSKVWRICEGATEHRSDEDRLNAIGDLARIMIEMAER